jgi:hypothetical protein
MSYRLVTRPLTIAGVKDSPAAISKTTVSVKPSWPKKRRAFKGALAPLTLFSYPARRISVWHDKIGWRAVMVEVKCFISLALYA